MWVHIRERNGRFHILEGLPGKISGDIKPLGVGLTRRQAMRFAKQMGHKVYVKGMEIDGMKDVLNLKLSSRDAFESGRDDGAWLNLPATSDELANALKQIGAVGEHGMDYFISEFYSIIPALNNLPVEHFQRMSIDELNYIAGQFEHTPKEEMKKLNATLELLGKNDEVRKIAEARRNNDSIEHIPNVYNHAQLGEHYYKKNNIKLPAEFKGVMDFEKLGVAVAEKDGGIFTENGYIYTTDSTWQGDDRIPKEYMIEQSVMEMASTVREKDAGRMYDAAPITHSNVKTENQAAVQRSTERTATADAERGKRTKPIYPAAPGESNVHFDPDRDHKQTLKMLENGVKDIFNSDKYKGYLDVLSKFYNYSSNNNVLIAQQSPGATYVAGQAFWRGNMRRYPRENVNPIRIIAPIHEKKQAKKLEFKTVYVLDVSQTYGQPMPNLTKDLTGSVEKYDDLFSALEKISPVPICFESLKGSAKGYYDQFEKLIAIEDGMSESQTMKTIIHEIAHARLHDIDNKLEAGKRPDSRTREIQAESIAYAVCRNYGLDTSDYSFGYIAEWSSGKDLPELKESLGIIRNETKDIIHEVDDRLREIQKERDIAISARVDKALEEKKHIDFEVQEHETMVQDILAEIKSQDPDFPAKGLADIENNMRMKSTAELRETDYEFYFPDKAALLASIEKTENKAQPKAPSKPASKTGPAKKSTKGKKPAPEKVGIMANLAAAKKQVASRKSDTPSKSQGMEL